MKPKICIISFRVNDLEKSLAFYRDGLGIIGEITRSEWHATIDLGDDVSLALFIPVEYEKFAGKTNHSNAGVCISHAAESKDEVDDLLRKVEAAGGTLPSEPKEYDWGYSGYFKDPDGHLWELVHFGE